MLYKGINFMSYIKHLRNVSTKLQELCRDSFENIQHHYRSSFSNEFIYSLQFLGTGQGTHNIASRGRQRLANSRYVSGPIITTPKTAIWIDPGPDCLEVVNHIDIDPRIINSIFITHAHTDHVGNLICATELITGATEIKKEKNLYGNNTTILGGPDNPSFIDSFHSNTLLSQVQALYIGQQIEYDDLVVTAIPSHHQETTSSNQSLNYKITMYLNDNTITISHIDGNIFIPDSNGNPSDKIYSDIIESTLGSDILIVNVSNHVRMRTSKQNYPSTTGLLKLIKSVQPSITFTTHFGIEMMNLNFEALNLIQQLGMNNLIEFQAHYIQKELDISNYKCRIFAAEDFMKAIINYDFLKIYSKNVYVDKVNL